MTLPEVVQPKGPLPSYEQWKAERQAYLDNRSFFKVKLDEMSFRKYNPDEAYYSLADEIKEREDRATPYPGEGLVQFVSLGAAYSRPLARLGWPGRAIYGLFKISELLLRHNLQYAEEINERV